jgi:RimJ/RimL family protein N-acetyltransferase
VRLAPGHLDALCRMDSDPQFMGLLGGPRDRAATVAYLERNLRHWDQFGFGLWMLRERGGGAAGPFLGRAVLRHLEVEGRDEVEIGYAFFPELWGRGLAPEIASACLRIGREKVRIPSMVAITLPENRRSQRVMAKVGMVYERDIVHGGLVHVLYRTPQGGTNRRLQPASTERTLDR